MSALKLVIAGGGTGGHLFPGVAVAEELRARYPDAELLFVGTERGIESRLLPELGWPLETIRISGLKTVGAVGALRGALRIPGALAQSRNILKRFAPDVVIGVGGYASGPVVMAARLMGLPTAILEQNSIPGLTNRMLSRFSRRIFLSFAHSQSFFPEKKSQLVGNPIRKEILESLQGEAGQRQKGRLFIVGGSQGAIAVNAIACQAAAILSRQGVEFSIVHQTGEAGLEATKEAYRVAGVDADCRAFISDMAAEYRAADVIISRAGATTIAELGVVGVPAILIPYPHAANNHQELNAREMVQGGAAHMLRQDDDEDGNALALLIGELLRDRGKRDAMAEAMRGFSRPDAAARIVDWISESASGV